MTPIENEGGKNVSITGGEGDDSINSDYLDYIYPDNATLSGDAGDDYIYNSGGKNVSISGGEGDDTINNW